MRGFGGIALAATLCVAQSAAARPVGERRVGVGVAVGEPTAVSGYLSLSDRFALDAAFGVVGPDEHDVTGHGDFLVCFGALYAGAGLFAIDYYGHMFGGLRVPLGVTIPLPRARLGFFAEISMELLLFKPYPTPRDEDFQASAGVRFFF